VRSGQVRSGIGQARSGQVRSGQVGLGQVCGFDYAYDYHDYDYYYPETFVKSCFRSTPPLEPTKRAISVVYSVGFSIWSRDPRGDPRYYYYDYDY